MGLALFSLGDGEPSVLRLPSKNHELLHNECKMVSGNREAHKAGVVRGKAAAHD